jgi:predicted dehydrogenase
VKRPIRWGILGCGAVTEVKSGPAFQQAEGSSLVAVMRRDGAKAEDYARRHDVARWYDDAERLIHDPEVDAVYVATPPSSHAALAMAVARAGKPAYVEKPMATSPAECDAMNEAFARARVPLFVAYYRRALPRFQLVKRLLDEGVIGAPRAVEASITKPVHPHERDAKSVEQLPWRVRPELAGGGHFVDLASHTLDLLDWLLGPIVEARGVATNQAGLYPAEDTVSASFRFASGVVGAGYWCFCADARRDALAIVGERGELRLTTFGDDPIVVVDGRGRTEHAIANPRHIQLPLVQTVVDALHGVGVCPSSGVSAARTTRVMCAILGRG